MRWEVSWEHLLNQTHAVLESAELPDQEKQSRQRQEQRRLTAAQRVEVAQKYRDGATMKELARLYSVHRVSISSCLRKLGIPIRNAGLSDAEISEAARLYADGWSTAQIGAKFGHDRRAVLRTLREHGVASVTVEPKTPKPNGKSRST